MSTLLGQAHKRPLAAALHGPLGDPQGPPSLQQSPRRTLLTTYILTPATSWIQAIAMPVPRDPRSRPRGHSSSSSMFPRGAGTTVQQAVERLNEASSNLSSLLEQPPRHVMDPDPREREYSGEAEVNRRRAKRRKVDRDQLSPGYKGFSYGYRGQVVPGPLKMEIVSCDGGVHATGTNHFQDNILRNDKSVYCTQSNECNIILRHQDETAFSIKKLIIKGPERGFTSPVQEGMIFVSMDSQELLPRTNAYRISEDPAPQTVQHRDPALLEELPVLDLDTGELLSEDHRPPSRRADASVPRTVPPPVSNSHMVDAAGGYSYPTNIFDSWSSHATLPLASSIRRPRDNLVPPANLYRSTRVLPGPVPANDTSDDEATPVTQHFVPRTPSPPMDNFTVTTDCSEPTSDEEEPSSAATLADLYRRDRATIYAEDSDNDSATDPELTRIINNGRNRMAGIRLRRNSRHDLRRELPSRIEVMHTWDPGHGSEHGPLAGLGLSAYERCVIETKAQMKGVLAPHARFFIEKEASCVTVNFEPAVSGRFILLKMWSPPKLHNIDIQSIAVHGFAGPRFFPAAQPL